MINRKYNSHDNLPFSLSRRERQRGPNHAYDRSVRPRGAWLDCATGRMSIWERRSVQQVSRKMLRRWSNSSEVDRSLTEEGCPRGAVSLPAQPEAIQPRHQYDFQRTARI